MTVFSKPLQLKFDIKKSEKEISYNSSVFLIGSCFSDNIAEKLHASKFNNLSNPFGVSYNPISINKAIQYFVANTKMVESDLFFENELYQCWDLHSSFSSLSKQQILENVNAVIAQTHEFILKADFIFITLGTSFVYELIETKQIVANCHKSPANRFTSKMLSLQQIASALAATIQSIQLVNKNASIYFTVSPVRHSRIGLVENNRSKALLFSAIDEVCQKYKTFYFPSFELINDVLRDYRFFAEDLVHPNSIAIDFVWENFVDVYCNDETKKLLQDIAKIKQAIQHKSNQPNSEAHKKFITDTLTKIAQLEDNKIDFSIEKNSLLNSI